jgi:ABC-type multidrug transport system fused ATPase/permease subunit
MQIYRRAISYFRNDVGAIVLLFTLIAIWTALSLLQLWPLAVLIDTVLKPGPPAEIQSVSQIVHQSLPVNVADHIDSLLIPHPVPETRLIPRLILHLLPVGQGPQIIGLAILTLLLTLGKEVVQMFRTLLAIRIGYNGLVRSRVELFRKLQQLSIGYHRSQSQGDAIYRVSYDAYGFQQVFNVFVLVVVNGLTLLVMAWIMFSMDWKLTLCALAIAPLLILTIKIWGKILADRSTDAKEIDSAMTTSLQRSMAAIGLVQAFGREGDEFDRFHHTVRTSVKTWLRLHWQEVLYWLAIGSIFAVGGAVIFGYGGWLVYRDQFVLHKEGGMTVGALTVFIGYLGMLFDPLRQLSSSGSSAAGAMAGVKRVFEVLDRDATIKDAPGAATLPRQPRTLQFDHAGFEYRPGEPVLLDVNVTIAPGQMVAFVGSSGVGKTTLLNLLPRFYDPTSGAMKLDGHDARTIKIADLRKHIALVLQESVILPTSVSENIAYGRPDATEAQIRRAAELAGAAAFIEKLPQKYESQISESGGNLSGGQRQRIAIARALLTEAPILVLDEPTSALDPQHEQMITETLRSLKKQRTIILVSHRLSTVADCDQIFVMDEGRIVERGTHEGLIAQRGLYFQMAKHQMKLEDDSVKDAPQLI